MTPSPSAPTRVPPEASPATVRHPKGWTLFPERGVDLAGVVLGERFEIQEPIGAGGMASVYVCKDLALHGLAAVKVLKDDRADARRRFADEARLLANLRNPHLVQVLAVGETEEQAPYMVLEYLPGRSLDERLRLEGPLPWREVVELAAQVAGALGALHEAGVIHRDVKPSNIVQLRSATGRPVAKLIDLGVAKVHDWARVQAAGFVPAPRYKTDIGKVVGTPGFYPPEVSLAVADPRFDTYALGVTMYQLCTGVMPDPGELRRMVEVRPGCAAPPELEALVAAAMAILPEDRVATADAFQRRLEAIRLAHGEDAEPFLFDGCYELIELIGVGAKAEVYRAYHRDAARYVALKLLGDRAKLDFEERLRFAREARVLAAVRHPALPELIDCRTATKRQQPYIAMALVKGRRAGDFCVVGRTLAPADVIAVGRQLAGALAALHERGIVHRDLNGSNVLIDLGRETTATLVDAGMAELTDRFYAVVEQRYPTPPEARIKPGSGGLERLDWTAPEARAGHGWTAKSDVYSLGLLLYRLLTGKRPFVGDAMELVPPRSLAPDCPRTLETALRWALSRDPDERVDATGLRAQLDEAVEEMNEARGAAEMLPDEPDEPPAAAVRGPEVVAQAAQAAAVVPASTWVRRGLGLALAAALLGLAWWAGRVTAPDPTFPTAPALVQPTPTKQPPIAPAVARTLPTPTLPAMREALDTAAVALRRCAALADGLLFVEFTTAADRDTFATVAVRGTTENMVTRCVREATASLRFAPSGPQVFTEEYMP